MVMLGAPTKDPTSTGTSTDGDPRVSPYINNLGTVAFPTVETNTVFRPTGLAK